MRMPCSRRERMYKRKVDLENAREAKWKAEMAKIKK